MAIVIADLFTEAADTNLESHTPNTGTAWTLVAGAAGACIVFSTTNALRTRTATASHYVSNPEPGSANTYVQFRLKSLSAAFPDSYACLRLVDNTNFIGWRLTGTGAAGRRLSKNVAGTITDLISSQGVDEEWIKVEASGDTIKLFEGGTAATPTWTQVGTDQTVTDHNTETSIGFQIGSAASVDWIDEYEGGTLSAGGVSAALTGQSLTTALGSVSATAEAALSGQAVPIAQGTVVVQAGITAAITGQSVTVAQGSVSPAIVSTITGQVLPIAQGTVSAAVSYALTGQAVTAEIGAVSAAIQYAITGQSVALSQGTVVAESGGVSAAITGQAVNASLGSVSAGIQVGLTGQSLSFSQGSISAGIGYGLSGQNLGIALGSVSSGVSPALTGQAVTVVQGSIGFNTTRALTGQAMQLSVGDVVILSNYVLSRSRNLSSNTQSATRSNTQSATRSNTQSARRPRA